MARLLLHNAVLVDPEAESEELGAVLVEDGRIRSCLGSGEPAPTDAEWVDLEGRALAPGFIDLHYHGGLVFETPEKVASSLERSAASLLRHGTTAFLPTTVAWSREKLQGCVAELARCIDDAPDDAAAALGLHLEGPWINAGAAGAQPLAGIRPYDVSEGRELLDRSEGLVKMVTLAPEIPGSPKLQSELARRGVVAALGHSQASVSEIETGIAAGLRHVTHLFNAMGGAHHRHLGVAGVALTNDQLTCDIICDGIHVHPAFVRLAARAKGERLMLITDRLEPPASAEAGSDSFGAGAVHEADGVLRLPDGTLAGSCLTLDRAVANAVAFGAMTRIEAVSAATLRPARVLGIQPQRGTFRPGARADFAVLGRSGEVLETWLAGQRVHAGARP